MRFLTLQSKDVIDASSGCKIGYVVDLELLNVFQHLNSYVFLKDHQLWLYLFNILLPLVKMLFWYMLNVNKWYEEGDISRIFLFFSYILYDIMMYRCKEVTSWDTEKK